MDSAGAGSKPVGGGVPVVVRLGEQDLRRVRLARSALWETNHLVRVLVGAQHGTPHGPWASRLPRDQVDLRLLAALNVVQGEVPDFVSPPPATARPDFDAELAVVAATDPAVVEAEVARALLDQDDEARAALLREAMTDPERLLADVVTGLRAVWERLLAPSWPALEQVLDADLEHRQHVLVTHGLDAVLEGLSERLTWSGSELRVDSPGDQTRELGGEGLLLVPSVLAWPHAVLVTAAGYHPAVVYPARGVAALWEAGGPPPGALSRLLGSGRARVLLATTSPTTTTLLASHLGLAASTVSEHLQALAGAGLVASARRGREVRYRRTGLGEALVRRSLAGPGRQRQDELVLSPRRPPGGPTPGRAVPARG